MYGRVSSYFHFLKLSLVPSISTAKEAKPDVTPEREAGGKDANRKFSQR